MTGNFDLLAVGCGSIIAPAGCGKTQLIADALQTYTGHKPILILTHTNAGVVALRNRLDKAGVKPDKYKLSTIDGWAIRLITTFPLRSGHQAEIISGQRPDYPKIREAAVNLLKARHINDVIAASYAHLLVDEYQDCSHRQHAIVYHASAVLPTCVMGDNMQAIFGFGDDLLADWNGDVLSHFKVAKELDRPWRWLNAGTEELGKWLLDARKKLEIGQSIDLRQAPDFVSWVQLDGTNDNERLLEAGKVKPPEDTGSVLIIGESASPPSQRRFASQTPGAVTVEAVDLRDLVAFARSFDINAPDALSKIVEFAQELMTNVGATDLLNRIEIILRGTARKEPTDVEKSALAFRKNPSYDGVLDLLTEINKQGGVRVFRPAVLHALNRAFQRCRDGSVSFYDATVEMREQNRLRGRPLPRRAVGSTLLLKGLEAEVAVILNGDQLDAKNLYVAMTRASKKLLICSKSPILPI